MSANPIKDNYEIEASEYYREYYGDVFVNNQNKEDSNFTRLKPEYQGLANSFDAFSHTYTSASLTIKYGESVAEFLGWANELRPNNTFKSENQDDWNNAKGREIGKKLGKDAKNKQIADAVYDAMKKGDIIIDKDNDPRIYDPNDKIYYEAKEANKLLKQLNKIKQDTKDAANQSKKKDPLIIDTNNDGLKLSNYNFSEVFFDLNRDGIKEKTGWVAKRNVATNKEIEKLKIKREAKL